jgi:hypothetical protein
MVIYLILLDGWSCRCCHRILLIYLTSVSRFTLEVADITVSFFKSNIWQSLSHQSGPHCLNCGVNVTCEHAACTSSLYDAWRCRDFSFPMSPTVIIDFCRAMRYSDPHPKLWNLSNNILMLISYMLFHNLWTKYRVLLLFSLLCWLIYALSVPVFHNPSRG